MRRADLGTQLWTAVEALGRYRLRTGLSVLGVVCGVAGVVAMTSVSTGARRETLAQVERLGLDTVIVRATVGATETRRLQVADADRLQVAVPDVTAASPLVEQVVTAAGMHATGTVRVLGVRAAFQRVVHLELAAGRLLTELDVDRGASTCVLGAGADVRLFGARGGLGRSMRLGQIECRVVGVLAGGRGTPASPNTMLGRDLDAVVLMPIDLLAGRRVALSPALPVDEIWLRLRRDASLDQAVATITRLIASGRSHAGVEVVVPRQILAQQDQTRRTFAVVVGSVAGLALIVGGIGIMNVMLASVVERTSEIGLRRATGATRSHIREQFLIESLAMTLVGGTAGVAVGALAAWGITAYAGWRTDVSPASVLIALVVSAAVGVTFGLYPALRASHLEPVEALRYE